MNETKFFTFQDCETVVRKFLKTDNVQTVDFAIISLQNQNFLVKITVNHEAKEKTLSFFAKSTPKKSKINQILFDEFEKTIPKFDPKITPKLYYGKPDLLLFEDLTWQGYFSRVGFFNLEEIRVVLRVLAKFHAGSFAYEEIKSRELGKSYRLSEEYKLVHSNVNLREDAVAKLISSLVGNREEKLASLVQGLEERQLSSKFRKTLCHSNLISENIMFKSEDGVPVECKLINFRSKHYAPPVYDVLQLVFFNTSEHSRQHHLESLLIHYYDCLQTQLEKYCLRIEEYLTIEDLGLSTNHLLPLIKLETVLLHSQNYDDNNRMILESALKEFEEIINCPLVTKEDCYIIIKNKIGTTNYDFLSFTVSPLDQVNGYLGDYHKLKIHVRFQTQEKTINCFVKCLPKSKSSKDIVQETGCFFKELFVYQTLVPEMKKLEINTINECLPSCYFHRSEDIMVFDDISQLNYRTLPSQTPFDFDLLSLTMKKLARFHASTLIFEEKKSEKLGEPYRLNQEYGQYLHEIFFSKENHSGARLMQAGVKSIADVANLFPDIKTKTNQDNLKKSWPKLEELFFVLTQPSDRYRNVFSHGDLWTNNIMVRFDGDQPIDCRLVDYQCTRYCPPAHDFLSVMYLTTDRAVRLKHEEEIRRVYHNELSEILASCGYNIGEVCSYEEFEESIDYMRPQIVMQAIMYRSFCLCSSEDISSMLVTDDVFSRILFEDRKEYLASMCEKSPVIKQMLRECVLDLYDLCDSMSSG